MNPVSTLIQAWEDEGKPTGSQSFWRYLFAGLPLEDLRTIRLVLKEAIVLREVNLPQPKLVGFPPASKIEVVKALREVLALGLREAKALSEALPVGLKLNEEQRAQLAAAGCVFE